ncbi:deoxyuridine 5'-triphosphate nucleotidohydrolase [Hydrogenoanaerobacterium saccharovorans]|uniref:Deoxyuridine 5'-triphosphate nucleotidohydrolase n=1 Tax=Hydrogenoanaerobacterium saccharovorans TaxID=474960 RepID=A0A1H8CHU4_9FIRM|nr:dUTP diphosphatase [Hydrogenoanaerobacterium saccharovorans]RPF43115.1 deoxyuridine 5'-triphosphate nucleotidohydrolase [Hydrogenoanaerobacterium saccharovorans]SEM94479.1 deoxyuridine 5'-triphosphate nucleotidohydrolase [Hydrogenoanaerobacterium saccharovorans]
MTLKIKKLREGAQIPQNATGGSAGYDLHACIDAPVTIAAGQTCKIGTGLAIALPNAECAAFVYARSGLGIKHGIVPANCVGVIDADYRGEIIVGLTNYSSQAFTVNPNDRIAQMVIAPVLHPKLEECTALDDTERGEGGFGSTGIGD